MGLGGGGGALFTDLAQYISTEKLTPLRERAWVLSYIS